MNESKKISEQDMRAVNGGGIWQDFALTAAPAAEDTENRMEKAWEHCFTQNPPQT